MFWMMRLRVDEVKVLVAITRIGSMFGSTVFGSMNPNKTTTNVAGSWANAVFFPI